ETVHRLEEDEFFDLEDFSSRGEFLAKVHTYQLYFNLARPNSHKGYHSPWQIIERIAPRSPLELCLLPPVFLDYYLYDSGGYDVGRLPYRRTRLRDARFGAWISGTLGSGFGGLWLTGCKRGVLRLGKQRGQQAASCRQAQPQAGDGTIAGDVDQVSAQRVCETAKDRGRQAVNEGKAGGAHVNGHNFREINNHRAVLTAIDEREPQFNAPQPGKGRIANQPQHRRIAVGARSAADQPRFITLQNRLNFQN